MTKKERHKDAKLACAALMKVYPISLEDLPDEEWLPAPDFPTYHVSNFGRVKSFKGKQRIIKPALSGSNYLFITLYSCDKAKPISVHRLVALAFIPNPKKKSEVNHRDGNKFNNHVSNLEWATSSENNLHAFNTGLMKSGEDFYNAKLTNEQVRYIRENPSNLTLVQLAEMFPVNMQTISDIQLGKRYKAAGGSVRDKITIRTPDNIRAQIRAEYQEGVRGRGSFVLAKKYGVHQTTILDIVNG